MVVLQSRISAHASQSVQLYSTHDLNSKKNYILVLPQLQNTSLRFDKYLRKLQDAMIEYNSLNKKNISSKTGNYISF